MAASDWIKVRTVLPTDGRLRIASRKCHVLPVTVFGALVTLWCLADAHAAENGELVGYTADDVDALVGVPGFCSALPADWIDLSGEFVKLPNYQEHNGTTGKTRAQDAKRQKRHRSTTEVSRDERDEKRTRGEEIREEEKKEAGGGERIPLDDGTEFPVTDALLAEFGAAYPRVDVLGELRKARAWCVANPSGRKTRRGVTRFLNSWLSRASLALPAESKASLPGGGRRAL